jgi:SET domain-containing protein
LGYVHDASDVDESSDYDLCLDRELAVGVDAKRAGNEARMVNDYRGVPGFQRPNVVFETRRVGEHGDVRMGLWVASNDVKEGVELCVSYGKGFWKERLKEDGTRTGYANSGQPVQES